MPLQATSGAASYDGFGGGVVAEPNYIESCFSTYLYTGNGSTQTITNGIDLAGKGGFVWVKPRNTVDNHYLYDTVRGVNSGLQSNTTNAAANYGVVSSFNSNGYTDNYLWSSSENIASWTFRRQPKFFDVVTYTGDGQNDRQVPHNLGSTPGCVIVKCLNFTGAGGPQNWAVYHRSVSPAQSLILNSTAAAAAGDGLFGTATSTYFVVNQPGGGSTLNINGDQYVAYVFAHNAGGFGLTGTDNVISCGLTTANGSGDFSVNLGYEPQWVLLKSTGSGRWSLFDNMRGVTASSGYTSSKRLQPQASDAEDQFDTPYGLGVNATGFTGNLATFSNDFIYIAIRRGPMKVPTDGTKVFAPVARAGTNGVAVVSGLNFPPDLVIPDTRTPSGFGAYFFDKLRGTSVTLYPWGTGAEITGLTPLLSYNMNGITVGSDTGGYINSSGSNYVNWFFRRAPSFFDEVCYTGTGSARTVAHNLGVAPELMIVKNRSGASNWIVYLATLGSNYPVFLNATSAGTTNFGATYFNSTAPTSSVFSLGTDYAVNDSGGVTYVAYLFATCAGVSKVGTYTGTGTTQQINCGFTAGARFVLIKRTDSTGDWYVWDTARGVVSGNDPYLLLNSTAAEVTITDYIDPYSAGFELSTTAAATVNVLNGTYIYLAIA